MTVFSVTRYKWMDNVICPHILQTTCICLIWRSVFRNLKMQNWLKTESSITCDCVQNTAADAANILYKAQNRLAKHFKSNSLVRHCQAVRLVEYQGLCLNITTELSHQTLSILQMSDMVPPIVFLTA